MAVIVALMPHPTRLQRLRAAARDGQTILPCESWDHVFQTLERQIVHLAVLDLEAAGAPNFDPVRRLKLQYPKLALVAYVVLTPERVRHVFDAGRFGFDEMVVADIDDSPTLFGRALEKAGARGVAAMIRRAIPESEDPVVRDALMVAVTRAHEHVTPAQLAKIVGVAPRQLSRHLADARYPSAHRLLMWGRLVVAAEILDDTRHSADRIAMTLHFPSGSAFRNTFQRYLQATPSEVRSKGGVQWVLDALKKEIGG